MIVERIIPSNKKRSSNGCPRSALIARALLVLLMMTLGIVAATSSASAHVPCSNTSPRAGGDAAVDVAHANLVNGIAGNLYVLPALSNFYGGTADPPTADIAMVNGYEFVQLGWLAYSRTDVRAFAGISNPNGGENLYDLGPLVAGASYVFSLRRDERSSSPTYRQYYAFINGVQKMIFPYDSPASMVPRVLMETTNACTQANAIAYTTTPPPYRTLQYHRESTGYVYWVANISREFQLPGNYEFCWTEQLYNGEVATERAEGPDDSCLVGVT